MGQKIFHVTSEGYSHLATLLPYGEYFILVDEQELKEVQARFEKWRDELGPCTDAIDLRDRHSLSSHVYAGVLELSDLPVFLQSKG